jgi:exopolysaccharide production protein ExoQ
VRTYTNQDLIVHRELDRPGGIEKVLVSIVFIFSSGLFDPSIVPDFGLFRINDLFMSVAAGVGVSLQFTRLRGELAKLSPSSLWAIFAFYGFVGLSIFWSHSPVSATARYIGFVLTTLWTLYAATRFSLRELLTILIATLFAMAIISLVLAIAVPNLGTMTVDAHRGDWKGIYGHKNTLGRNMALLTYLSLFCVLFSGPRKLGLASLAVALLVLFMAGSRTAYIVSGIGLFSVLLLVLRRRPWIIVLVGIGTAFAVLTATLQSVIEGNPALQLQAESIDVFQTEISFTGRFGLWQFSIEWIAKQPWFGYGYDGFWKIKELGGQHLAIEGWGANDSHNGYIDILLQIGFIGLIVYFFVYFTFLFRSGLRIRRERISYEDLFASLILFVFFFANLTESYLLKATSIFQLLFTYSLILLSKKRKTSVAGNRRNEPDSQPPPPPSEGRRHSLLRPKPEESADQSTQEQNVRLRPGDAQ